MNIDRTCRHNLIDKFNKLYMNIFPFCKFNQHDISNFHCDISGFLSETLRFPLSVSRLQLSPIRLRNIFDRDPLKTHVFPHLPI